MANLRRVLAVAVSLFLQRILVAQLILARFIAGFIADHGRAAARAALRAAVTHVLVTIGVLAVRITDSISLHTVAAGLNQLAEFGFQLARICAVVVVHHAVIIEALLFAFAVVVISPEAKVVFRVQVVRLVALPVTNITEGHRIAICVIDSFNIGVESGYVARCAILEGLTGSLD